MRADELSAERIQVRAGGGWEVHVVAEVTSTQDVARQMAMTRPSQQLAVVADYQSAGRGQAGRIWIAPAGGCLLMSALVRPARPSVPSGLLPALAALAVADGILDVTGLLVQLSWPNDVLSGDRKVAGLLVEASWIGDEIEYAVIGVGVNVNLTVSELAGLPAEAGSLLQAIGHPIDRSELAGRILARIGEGLAGLQKSAQGQQEIIDRWRDRLSLEGRLVRVKAGQQAGLIGRIQRVGDDGRLHILTGAGLQELSAGQSSIELED